METFLKISMYSAFVLSGLGGVAVALVLLGKFLNDVTYDPDKEH
ncbi:hypothetical protein BH24DEI2_BH24DEI2_23530 [soil metagenome]